MTRIIPMIFLESIERPQWSVEPTLRSWMNEGIDKGWYQLIVPLLSAYAEDHGWWLWMNTRRIKGAQRKLGAKIAECWGLINSEFSLCQFVSWRTPFMCCNAVPWTRYCIAIEDRYSQLRGLSSTSFLNASQDVFLNRHPLKIFVSVVIIDLTYIYILYILIHMKTTLNIDETMLKRASELTGINEKTALVRLGLQALIAQESSRRLAKLGGTEKSLRPIPRRRPANK